MVFRMELTYNEIENILDMKYIDASTTGRTLEPGVFEVSDFNLMIKSSLPDEVIVINSIDDIRLRSNLTINSTSKFTEKSFFIL